MKNVFVFLLCAAFFSCMAYKQSQSAANDNSIAISQLPTLPDEYEGAVWMPVTWQGKTYKYDISKLTPATSLGPAWPNYPLRQWVDSFIILNNGDTLRLKMPKNNGIQCYTEPITNKEMIQKIFPVNDSVWYGLQQHVYAKDSILHVLP